MTDHYRKLRLAYLAIVLLELVAVELPGARDYARAPYAGYEMGPESSNDFNSDYLVPPVIGEIRSGSPAEKAGLRRGDRVLRVEGIPFGQQERIIGLGRPKIGEARSLVIERNGAVVPVQIIYEKNPEAYHVRYTVFLLIAVLFLTVGTICFWLFPSATTSLLFWFGFCGAFVFMHKPYFASFAARTQFALLRWLLTSLWLATLVHFLFIFPRPKAAMKSRRSLIRAGIYVPCLLLFSFIAYYTLFPSRLVGRGSLVMNIVFLFIGTYLVAAAAAFAHSFLGLKKSEQTPGLKIMLFGTALGLLPIAISIILGIATPSVHLPNQEYYILTLALIPVSFGYAVLEQMKAVSAMPAVAVSSKREIG